MSPDQARAIAAGYVAPEASAELLLLATAPERSEDQLRAARALRWLDRTEDLGELALDVATPSSDPLLPFALAVASVQLECLRAADAGDRRRLMGLLTAVCKEASVIAKRRGSRAA